MFKKTDSATKKLEKKLAKANEKISALEKEIVNVQNNAELVRLGLKLYHSLIDTSPDAIWLTDLKTKVIMVNRQAALLSGFETMEDMIGKSVFDFIEVGDHPRLNANVERLKKEKVVRNVEYRFKKTDGTVFLGELSAAIVYDFENNPKAIIGTVRDVTERKRVEFELKASEEKYKTIVENSREVIMLTIEGGIVSYISPSCKRVFGYQPEDLMGKKASIVHEDDALSIRQVRKKALQGEKGFNVEYRIKTKQGDIKWVSHSWAPIFIEDKLSMVVSVISDITERKNVEDELKRAHDDLEQRVKTRTKELTVTNLRLQEEIEEHRITEEQLLLFHRFIEESGEGMGWADLDGAVRYVNSTLCNMFGETDPENVCGKSVLNYYDKETQKKIRKEVFPSVLKKGYWKGEIDITNKAGEKMPTMNSLFALRDDSGRPVSFANVLTDLTERKKIEKELQNHQQNLENLVAERTENLERINTELEKEISERENTENALRDSEQRYRTIVENSTELIMLTGPDFTINYLSPSCCDILGFMPEELIGKEWSLVHNDDLEKVKKMFLYALSGGKGTNFEYRIVVKDKRIKWVSHSWAPIISGDKLQTVVSIISDVTERKKAEDLKDEFVNTVSHELRTPLSIVKEGIDLVLDQIPGQINEKQQNVLKVSQNNINRLVRIINNLLDLSKIEAGKMELKRSMSDVVSLVEQVIFCFQPKVMDKNIVLDANFSSQEIKAYIDSDKIIQVLTNLINNSFKFTEKGKIIVSVVEKDNEVVFTIEDTGSGIAQADIPYVFNKFHRFSRTSQGRHKGTGLGLSIVKSIIELHKGTVDVKSKVGEGTVFTFVLPKYEFDV